MRVSSLQSFAFYRRFLFVLSLTMSLVASATMPGCGDDEEAPPGLVDVDAAVDFEGGHGSETSTNSDSGNNNDSSTTTDTGADVVTEDVATDAADAGDAADAEEAGDANDGGTDAAVPALSIDNVTLAEGSSGTTSFTFTVTLDSAAAGVVTVDYATADGSATSADYTATSGTLTFNPGDTSKTITVSVIGDTLNETNETFTVGLSNASGATIATATGTGTITDDDAAPTISIADAIVAEGNSGTTPATFIATLSAASGQTITVTADTANSTATAGADYTALTGTVITFAPGETTKNIVVDVTGDTTVEPTETFTVTLSSPTNVTIADGSATGTIQNDDGAAQPGASIDDPTVVEGNAGTKILNFTVTLAAPGAQVATIDFATANGTATTAGNDYQATAGTVTFGLGETQKTISVVIVGDTANENDETFTVTLSNPTNALITKAVGTGTITNDDAQPTVVISDATIAEGQAGTSALTFTATLSAASGKTVTVNYASADGTATSGGTAAAGGQDYTDASGTLTFAPGTTTQQVTVSVNGDLLNEQDENLTVTLAGPTNATLGAKVTGTGTIQNDDALPLIVINDAAVDEGDTGTVDMVFTVSLVNASANPAPSGRTVTVNYATGNVTAVAPGDYTAVNGTLTFNPGETTKTITVQANGDTTAETAETFSVTLSAPTNATIQDNLGVGTIQNDDGNLPLLNIDDQSIVEGDSGTKTMTFTVTLSAASSQNVTVAYTTSNGTAVATGNVAAGGSDYLTAVGILTFLPGELTKTIDVTIRGDVANEADETFNVTLSGVSTTAAIQDGTGVGTITNDDAVPTLSINDVTMVEGNSGQTNMVFTVTLSAISGRNVAVSFATADGTAVRNGLIVAGGTDYAARTGTLSFTPGVTTRTISIPINGDTTLENDESFTVTLATPVNADINDGTGVGTITNDDAPPTLSISDVTLAEGTPAPNTSDTTSFTFTVTLSNPRNATVTVAYATADGTATAAGNDYEAGSGTLTFLPGDTSKTIVVLVQKDSTAEASETFTVNLSAPTNATIADSQGVGGITNDD